MHFGLLGRPAGIPLRPAGLRATFLRTTQVHIRLEELLWLRLGNTFRCHRRVTAIAGSELQQLPFQLFLLWQFLFPGLLYPEAESGLNHSSSIPHVASPFSLSCSR